MELHARPRTREAVNKEVSIMSTKEALSVVLSLIFAIIAVIVLILFGKYAILIASSYIIELACKFDVNFH